MRLLIALFAVATALVAQPRTGAIAGTVADRSGGLLPGTKVTVASRDVERTAVTDAAGRFTIAGLPPGRYSVTAELAGFETVTRDGVRIRAGQTGVANLVLKIGCIAEAVRIDYGFAKTRALSDLIAFIRISKPVPKACRSAGYCACTMHEAEVVRVIKGPGRLAGTRIELEQEGAGALTGERPYEPGTEFVAFLQRDTKSSSFQRITGPLYIFPIRDGRVDFKRKDAPGLTDGMTVDEFYQILTRF